MGMPPLPPLRQLAYLVELSERLNFRVAAEAQFVTQSTLSAGIKELEKLLGVQLVERDKRHVRLTAVGEDVVARARELLAAARDLAEAALAAARPLSGPLRLGAIPTIAPYRLPKRASGAAAHARRTEALPARGPHEGPARAAARGPSRRRADRAALRYRRPDVRELFKDEFSFVAREADPAVRSVASGVSGTPVVPRNRRPEELRLSC